MAKNKTSCVMVPNAPGTESKSTLYQGLDGLLKDRSLTNLVYAMYLSQGVGEVMDKKGFKRNPQNQHIARDVYKFLGLRAIKNDLIKSLASVSKSEGFTDSSGMLIDFTDGEEAYKKALEFNSNSKSRVAYVISRGDKFNIIVTNRDSLSINKVLETETSIKLWEELLGQLSSKGVNTASVLEIDQSVTNPGDTRGFINYLSSLRFISNTDLTVREIEYIMSMNPGLDSITNLNNKEWGSLEEAATKVYNILQGTEQVPSGVKQHVEVAITAGKSFQSLNLNSILNTLNTIAYDIASDSPTQALVDTIEALNNEYHLDSKIVLRKSTDIKSMSDVLADAALSLERQIRIAEETNGPTQLSRELRENRDLLLEELNSKRYQSGTLRFLSQALSYIVTSQKMLEEVASSANSMEYVINASNTISSVTNLHDSYTDIAKVLAYNIDTLSMDVSISDEEIKSLKEVATSVIEELNKQDKVLTDTRSEIMTSIGSIFIGEHSPEYAPALADIITMGNADTSTTDYLYSVGNTSSPVINMMGAIIREAQDKRTEELIKISTDIGNADYKLKRAGHSSDFIYEEEGRIASQYDWTKFFKKKAAYHYSLIEKQGLNENSLAYKDEMEAWEEKHTVELVVDKETGRTERVPIYQKEVPFDANWTQAQKEYYREMMDIKGRIGTLLPAYAQHQFLPPQKRAKWYQLVKDGVTGKRPLAEVTRGLLKKAKFWEIKEDDTNFTKNGINLDGEKAMAVWSSQDNTILKKIPIFFVKKLSDQGELSHDFSGALQSLASTALNYSAMNEIKNTCELMTAYTSHNPIRESAKGSNVVDTTASDKVVVTSFLRKANQSLPVLMQTFLDIQVYGQSNRKEDWKTVALSNLIGYTSWKALSKNTLGAISNWFVGIAQDLIVATRGEFYNLKDLAWAEMVLSGERGRPTLGAMVGATVGGFAGAAVGAGIGTALGAKGLVFKNGKIIDSLTGSLSNKDSLIDLYFDSTQDTYSTLSRKDYHNTVFGRIFGEFDSMHMYSGGEFWIHQLITYSILHHEKVVIGGKEVSLYDALKVDTSQGKLGKLVVDGKATTLMGDKITDDYLRQIKRRVRYATQKAHGAMNKEDKGIIHQIALGRLLMNFRQWMVESYHGRYGKLHWAEAARDGSLTNFFKSTKVLLDGKRVSLDKAITRNYRDAEKVEFDVALKDNVTTLSGEELTSEVLDTLLEKYANESGWRMGFKRGALAVCKDYIQWYDDYSGNAAQYWDTLTEAQKGDVKQTLGAALVFGALLGLQTCMGDPDRHRGEWAFRVWQYAVRRVFFDELSFSLPGLVFTADNLFRNIFPARSTFVGLIYPIYGLFNGDLNKYVQSGRHRGMTKYKRNALKYSIPFYAQIDALIHLAEEDGPLKTLEYSVTR